MDQTKENCKVSSVQTEKIEKGWKGEWTSESFRPLEFRFWVWRFDLGSSI